MDDEKQFELHKLDLDHKFQAGKHYREIAFQREQSDRDRHVGIGAVLLFGWGWLRRGHTLASLKR